MYKTHHGFTAIIGIGVIHVVSIRGIEQHRMQKHFIRAGRIHEITTHLGPFINNVPCECLGDAEPFSSFPENESGTSKTINMQQKALRHEHYSFDLTNVSPDSILQRMVDGDSVPSSLPHRLADLRKLHEFFSCMLFEKRIEIIHAVKR